MNVFYLNSNKNEKEFNIFNLIIFSLILENKKRFLLVQILLLYLVIEIK